ncbi:MAG TPA: O-antigen ligase family protein [Stellaceae bacterium]|jgi:O-antigen ligase
MTTPTEPLKKLAMRPAAAPVGAPDRARIEASKTRIFWGLLAVVAAAPAPLGSAWPLAWELLGLAVAGLILALLLVARDDREPQPRALTVPALLLALVLIYAFVQSLPRGGRWANPLWDVMSEGLRLSASGAIAVDPMLARDDLFRLLSYAGIFALAHMLGRDRVRAQSALTLLTFAGAFYALYGLAAYWLGNTTILWFAKSSFRADLSASFVNPNTAATYFGLALLAAVADLVAALEPLRLVGPKQIHWRRLPPFALARRWHPAALIVLIIALLLTHSRGGLAATLIGLVALFAAVRAAPSLQSIRYVAWAAIPLAIVLVALLFHGEASMTQLMALDRAEGGAGDVDVIAITWQAAKDFAFLGTGLGSFADVFQIYRPETIANVVTLAHDDYLQDLLELGVPAALCLFAAIAWLAALCLRGVWWRNRDAVFPALGFAATLLVACHAFLGVGLQVPAVASTYMLILGVAVAQSRSTAVD